MSHPSLFVAWYAIFHPPIGHFSANTCQNGRRVGGLGTSGDTSATLLVTLPATLLVTLLMTLPVTLPVTLSATHLVHFWWHFWNTSTTPNKKGHPVRRPFAYRLYFLFSFFEIAYSPASSPRLRTITHGWVNAVTNDCPNSARSDIIIIFAA